MFNDFLLFLTVINLICFSFVPLPALPRYITPVSHCPVSLWVFSVCATFLLCHVVPSCAFSLAFLEYLLCCFCASYFCLHHVSLHHWNEHAMLAWICKHAQSTPYTPSIPGTLWHRRSDSPGQSPKGSGESLQQSNHKPEGILTGDDDIDGGQGDEAVDDQANNHSEGIHGKLEAYITGDRFKICPPTKKRIPTGEYLRERSNSTQAAASILKRMVYFDTIFIKMEVIHWMTWPQVKVSFLARW